MNCKVCENTSAKNNSVSFFRFPKENSRCKDWAERCNLLSMYEKHGTLRFYKSFRICSDHFNPKDIVFDGRKKRLLQSATPQIYTGNKIKAEKDESNDFTHEEIFKLKLVENLCRLCAEENRNLTDVFGWRGRTLNLEDKLKYFPVVMTKYDVLPLRVCHQCISKVNQFYDFIMNCMKAETKLRIMLDLEDCDTTYKMIKSDAWKDDCSLDPGMDKKQTKETPNVDSKSEIDDSGDLIVNLPETVLDSYNEFHQVLRGNLSNSNEKVEIDYLHKEPETNCTETNQLYLRKLIHTNYIKEVDSNRNISYEHNYSNAVLRDQLSVEQNIQTENEQNLSEETKVSCDVSLESFSSVEVLNSHSSSHCLRSDSSREEFTCETGDKVFFDGCDSDEHISDRPEEDLYKCQICDKNFHKVAFLKKHSLLHHFESSFGYFPNTKSCQIQVESDIDISKTNLGDPNRRQKSPKLLKNNIKSNGGIKRKCHFCDRMFKNRQVCLVHEKSHTGETPYWCRLCGKTFRSRQSLRQHRSVHSDKRLFTCQECGMSFKRKDTLRNHLRIHTGERPFVCKFCGFAFKQRGDCIKHEKNHEKTSEMGTKESPGSENEAYERTFATSTVIKITEDMAQTREGTLWSEEKSLVLPSFITVGDPTSPGDALQDLIAGRIISHHF